MELEIKVMWCKGLTAFNFFQKLTVYAAVSIATENETLKLTQEQKQEQKTPVDYDGDGNPEWNHPIKFDLRLLNSINPMMKDLSLRFELRNHGQVFGDKTVGEVRVPLTDLIQSVGGGTVRFVCYEVRNPEGKHNGVLDFSYKVIGNDNTGIVSHVHHITGYPHHHHHHHHQYQSQVQYTNSDVNVIRYDHQHQIDQSHVFYANSDVNVNAIGYHHHQHQQQKLDESVSLSDSEKIQYPKIDLDEPNPLLLSSAHYPAPALYPPPPPTSQTWDSTPPQPPHYQPHPPPQPYHYPPPPPQQQPYGEPHWGYHRPSGYHHW